MSRVVFLTVKTFVSCDKNLQVSYHIPSTIAQKRGHHYVALCEADSDSALSNPFTWTWTGQTVPLEPSKNGLTVEWRKGTVAFDSSTLPKLSDGREYLLAYFDEEGTCLGSSQSFQFCTDSDEFSSIDLQSVPSDDVVMVHITRKKAPFTNDTSEVNSFHPSDGTSFEVISGELPVTRSGLLDTAVKTGGYLNLEHTTEPAVKVKGDKKYLNLEPATVELSSATGTIKPAADTEHYNRQQRVEDDMAFMGGPRVESATKNDVGNPITRECGDDEVKLPPGASYYSGPSAVATVATHYSKEVGTKLFRQLADKELVIEQQAAEIGLLKEQIAVNTLSASTVMVNPSKEDMEKRILNKRILEEKRKTDKLESLLTNKENKNVLLEKEAMQLRNELSELTMAYNYLENSTQSLAKKADIEKQNLMNQLEAYRIQMKENEEKSVRELEGEQNNKQILLQQTQKVGFALKECSELEVPVEKKYKANLLVSLFKQDPFVCSICSEILPAHTQEFSRMNHVAQCKGKN